ncbi:hypothetical protein QJS10_CPA09g01169 [Acorus calamus]|uniref:Uncharacterized protein n=1 Tax=Acorus calamus TaxID=4465 RepID=A0AAV9E878_ACOCL|nr:hypothetical protein QJS10_CPA09g01169 [Acorus calamus]
MQQHWSYHPTTLASQSIPGDVGCNEGGLQVLNHSPSNTASTDKEFDPDVDDVFDPKNMEKICQLFGVRWVVKKLPGQPGSYRVGSIEVVKWNDVHPSTLSSITDCGFTYEDVKVLNHPPSDDAIGSVVTILKLLELSNEELNWNTIPIFVK